MEKDCNLSSAEDVALTTESIKDMEHQLNMWMKKV